jgi:hypothetical protein
MKKKTPASLRKDLELYAEYCENFTIPAQNHGRATATHLFVSMLNPKYRGPNFTWDIFVRMASKTARATVYQGFSDADWNRYGPLLKESAGDSARLVAMELLRDSDVQSWLPLVSEKKE